jgi:Mg-chelatase subunit ChlD
VLDAPPSIYRGGSAPGAIIPSVDGVDPVAGSPVPPPSVTAGFTSEVARTRPLSEVLGKQRVDPELLAEAATIASQLALRPRRAQDRKRGRTRPTTVRFDGGSDELDLDRTIDLLSEGRPLASTELYVRRPLRSRRSVALLADVSGSMDGAKARICAAAIGALAGELVDDELTVIAFWKDVAVLRVRASHLDPVQLLDELMRIEPGGLTNVSGALELASAELSRSSLERRAIVLLSDCVHNAGPDPRSMARRAPTTHVLLEQTGEHDAWLGERIARAGGGRYRSISELHEVAPALSFLLAD